MTWLPDAKSVAVHPTLLATRSAVLTLALLLGQSQLQAFESEAIVASLEKRLKESPADATTWRMLGRIRLKNGQLDLARSSLLRALELDPELVSAHFDLANTLQAMELSEDAAEHYAAVIRLAPDCEYASEAELALLKMDEADENQSKVTLASWEIKRFDGSEYNQEQSETPVEAVIPKFWSLRLEIGALFNSNPGLAPISRSLTPAVPETFQGVFSPELELRLFECSAFTFGSMFRGTFTLNEGNVRSLNLQSYQPGIFFEKVFLQESSVLVGRAEYLFSHDEFDLKTLGNRHTVFASLASVAPSGSMTFGYVSVDNTNFMNDGLVPQTTSQDGWTTALGLSHRFALNRRWLKSVRIGADGRYANLDGANFRFAGASLFADSEIPLTTTVTFKPEAGWGIRDYFDFTGTPSRNENIWRYGARLEKRFNSALTLAAVFNYENFDTKNTTFAAERYTAGIVTIFSF